MSGWAGVSRRTSWCQAGLGPSSLGRAQGVRTSFASGSGWPHFVHCCHQRGGGMCFGLGRVLPGAFGVFLLLACSCSVWPGCVAMRAGAVSERLPVYPPSPTHPRLWGGRWVVVVSCVGTPQVAYACCLPSPSFEQMYIYFYSNGKSNWIVS